MKGIVFTEFLDMVEQAHGYIMVDDLLNNSELPSGGIYTSVGTYDHREMAQLVTGLGSKTQTPIPALLKQFGHHLFGVFLKSYPAFFETAASAFDFLESIENHIHVEVLKLYPDAELPKFQTTLINENTLEMIYLSDRSMADFAEGLIEKTLEYYEEAATIEREELEMDGRKVKFLIKKR